MEKDSSIFVAGHKGLVGSSLVRTLKGLGYSNIITADKAFVDLTRQSDVESFFSQYRPEYVFLAAAKVGGIYANSTYPAEFSYSNLAIQLNVINSAYNIHVKKLCFLGSVCIYPKFAQIPVSEESLLSSELEPSNEAYAIAKISGISMCKSYNKQYGTNFISAMPANLYGPGDNYHPTKSHIIPGLLRRFYEAVINNKPEVTVWGSGKPLREFLYVDDLSDALIFLMNNYNDSDIINIGSSQEYTIEEVANTISLITGHYKMNGSSIKFDLTKPDGTFRRLLNSSKIFNLGWSPQVSFYDGLKASYADFIKRYNSKYINNDVLDTRI